MRLSNAAAKLAEAQLQVARDYGFASWRALKAFIDRPPPGEPDAGRLGFYRHDPLLMSNAAVAITRDATGLWFEAASGERLALQDQSDGRALIAGLDEYFTWDGEDGQPARALIHHRAGRMLRMERVDPAVGEAMRAAMRVAAAEQARPRVEVAVPLESLERYVGHYASPVGVAARIGVQHGRLLAQMEGQPELEVIPEAETRFFYRQLPVQLAFVVADQRVKALVVHQNGFEQRLERVSAVVAQQMTEGLRQRLAEQQRPRVPVTIDPAILDHYAGRYRLDASHTLDVVAQEGRLFVQVTGQPRFEVHPESDTCFFWTVVAAQISFFADDTGTVTLAVLHQNGRDLAAPRLSDERTDA